VSSILLGFVRHRCSHGEVRHGRFAHPAPHGFGQRLAGMLCLRGGGATQCTQLSHYFGKQAWPRLWCCKGQR
jgi:hypothetical protein